MSVARLVRRLAVAAGLAAGLAAPIAAPAQAEPWPITRFDIVAEGPDGEPAAGPLPAATERALEGWLSEVARYYESLGFRPPVIEPVVTMPDGEPAFRIYLFDLMSKHGLDGNHFSQCTEATPTLMYNHDTVVTSAGDRTERSWPLLAHELFHAVQSAYPMFTETCDRGLWIVEGTAEAVAIDTASRLAGIEKNADLPTIRWGGRRYDMPLYIRETGDNHARDSYRTASFWRYLAEVAATGEPQPGRTRVAGDYGYLADLFETGAGTAATEAAEMDWIDRALTERFGIGLPTTLTTAAATIESWIPARGGAAGYRDVQNRVAWRRALFDGCQAVTLSPDQPTETVVVALDPFTAGCITVRAAIDGRASIHVTASADSDKALRTLGMAGARGMQVPATAVWQGDTWRALWRFQLPGGSEEVLVVANALQPTGDTPGVIVPMTLTLNGFSSALTEDRPEEAPWPDFGPPMPSPGERADADPPEPAAEPGRDPAGDRVAEAAAERIDAALDAASASANGSTSVGREPDARPCPEPFVFLACGPRSRISLRLLPGDAMDMTATFGRGGVAGQFAAMVEGMQQMGMAEALLAQQQAMERLAGTPGSEITIVLPLIDYGFEGSFSNALISVAGGEDGGLVTMGPGDAIPGRGRGYPLSGRVTIETYSPNVMIGTFAGDLVDPDEQLEGDDASRTVVTSVEGRFFIASPFVNDRRYRLQDPRDPMARAREDLALAFPELGRILDGALPEGTALTPGGTAGSSSGGGAVTTACDCSCNDPQAVAAARPDCVPRCQATWAACTADPPPAVSPASAEETAAETAALRAHFADGMAEIGWPEMMIDQFLDGFDGLESLEEKRFFMLSLGVPPPDPQSAE